MTSAGSFVGTWYLRDDTAPVGSGRDAITIAANGAVSCFDRVANQSFACSLSFTNVAAGTFTFTFTFTFAWTADQATASGRFDLVAATASGTWADRNETPATGHFVGTRR